MSGLNDWLLKWQMKFGEDKCKLLYMKTNFYLMYFTLLDNQQLNISMKMSVQCLRGHKNASIQLRIIRKATEKISIIVSVSRCVLGHDIYLLKYYVQF